MTLMEMEMLKCIVNEAWPFLIRVFQREYTLQANQSVWFIHGNKFFNLLKAIFTNNNIGVDEKDVCRVSQRSTMVTGPALPHVMLTLNVSHVKPV
jgi:hypothetical protein